MTTPILEVPTGDEFDDFVLREKFQQIESVPLMITFLSAVLIRLQQLNCLARKLDVLGIELSDSQSDARIWMRDQLKRPTNDLHVYFTELDDFRARPRAEQKDLLTWVDSLRSQLH
jgi:hypothetical protein